MMGKPLISIVVPVYNTETFLRKCLNSIINQTYKNLEIIVGNNSSTDNSLSIINEYAEKDSRIKVVQYEFVPTVYESRAKCYMEVTSDWIVPIDSDDYVSVNYIEELWERHIETNADFVGGTMVFIDGEGNEYNQIPNEDFDFESVIDGKSAIKYTIGDWRISGNGALQRRSIVVKNNTVINQTKIVTDEVELRKILRDSYKVAFCGAKYYFNYNPNSTGRKVSWRKFSYILATQSGLLDFVREEYGIGSKEWKTVATASIRSLFSVKKFLHDNNDSLNEIERNKLMDQTDELFSKIKNIRIIPVFMALAIRYIIKGL